MNIKNIAVIGVGGVGGYFGGTLCSLKKDVFDISFIARGEHLRAIQASGLLLSSEQDGDLVCKPTLVTDDFQLLPPPDLCLICVKEFDLPSVLSALQPLVGKETILLPLLNGVDIYSRVRSVIKNGIVLPACVYVGTHIERPGKVFQKGGSCRILFGPDPVRPDFAPGEVLRVFEQAGIKCEWTLDVQVEIWKKFIFICGYGLVSAARGKVIGEILGDDALRKEVQAIMSEAAALARKSGVVLPNDIVEASLAKGHNFPFQTRTSFQRDFERMDKNDERDLFAGTLIRMGERLGMDVSATRSIFTVLHHRKPVV